MPRWSVTVDSPEMGSKHVLTVHAGDELSAMADGARAAIRADRRGAGVGCPVPDYGDFKMPMAKRREQAGDDALVAEVAAFATAVAA